MLKELIARTRLETPRFFRKLAGLLVALSLITGSTLAGNSMLGEYYHVDIFPEWADALLKHITFAGFCCSAVCKLAVTKPEEINAPQKTPGVRE